MVLSLIPALLGIGLQVQDSEKERWYKQEQETPGISLWKLLFKISVLNIFKTLKKSVRTNIKSGIGNYYYCKFY